MSEKRALVVLAEGAEEMETIISVDVLRRGGVNVTLAGLTTSEPILCSRNVMIKPDTSLTEAAKMGPYDLIVLPGGAKGAQNLAESASLGQLLKDQESSGRLIAAICAGPTALKKHGIARTKHLTSHPSVKESLEKDYQYSEERVVQDGSLITSRGPGTTFEYWGINIPCVYRVKLLLDFRPADQFLVTMGLDKDLQVEGGRVKGVTIVKPIVYGNVARYFGKKREEDGHTHQWTLFVKPYKYETMSQYVKKVHFKLHDSYANSNRVVTSPPYEVSETGWGEFEAIIKIYFEDPNDKPVTIYHVLKLFQNDPQIMSGKKLLVSEFYDELVFNEPSVELYKSLTGSRSLSTAGHKHEDTDFESKKERTLEAIRAAHESARKEILEMKETLKEAKTLVSNFKELIKRATDS